ncbi:MAG TPA: 50S ribosomal protein L15 [Actinomycetota bacterium]|nr:50S ribosomal protein L15 [Actinomycetota bacterium]
MKLHDLKPAEGSKHRIKRVGRGESSGIGKTSGRGVKGTKARKTVPPGFQGGQMPLQRRLPKWGGFTPRNRVEYAVVNVARLDATFDAGAEVGPEEMHRHGLVRKGLPVKVLGQGEISTALTVRAHRFSGAAAEKIQQAGGRTEVI